MRTLQIEVKISPKSLRRIIAITPLYHRREIFPKAIKELRPRLYGEKLSRVEA